MNTELNLSDMNWCKATIDQQAERIKELEAERDAYRNTAIELRNYADRLMVRGDNFRDELAALRQRIADAPVVMWVHKDNDLLIRRTWPSEAGFYQLISKEDLQG